MTHYTKRTNGTCGVISFGVKNPEVDVHNYLREMDLVYRHESNGLYESFQIPFEGGDIYVIDILDFMNDRLKMDGVIGYAVGRHQEGLETMLRKMMSAAGVVQAKNGAEEGTQVYDLASQKLDKLMQMHAASKKED